VVDEVQEPTRRGRRLPVLAVGSLVVVLVGAALVVAVRPYDVSVDLAPSSEDVSTFTGTCDAAAGTAWKDDSKDQLALWAVTIGTNMMGYTPAFGTNVKYVLRGDRESAFPGTYCVGEARHRMLVSGTLLLAALAVVTVAVYARRRSSSSPKGSDVFQI
jgi:hypothetical protein